MSLVSSAKPVGAGRHHIAALRQREESMKSYVFANQIEALRFLGRLVLETTRSMVLAHGGKEIFLGQVNHLDMMPISSLPQRAWRMVLLPMVAFFNATERASGFDEWVHVTHSIVATSDGTKPIVGSVEWTEHRYEHHGGDSTASITFGADGSAVMVYKEDGSASRLLAE
jgi:hypothetical protein